LSPLNRNFETENGVGLHRSKLQMTEQETCDVSRNNWKDVPLSHTSYWRQIRIF